MKRLLFLLLSLVVWTNPQRVRAQVPLGDVVATFPYHASKVLADPYRPRVYVTDVDSNSVIAIDTATLSVVGILPTGSNPADMAISLDGKLLYVANRGSTIEAIDLIDLDSFTEPNSFSLTKPVVSIAAGLDGRVYAGTNDIPGIIYQLDGATGAVQVTTRTSLYETNFLQISPDGNTLFGAESGLSPSTIQSFDVSGSQPVALQSLRSGSNGEGLVISHNGAYLCFPCGAGNDGAGTTYQTLLYSTADITTYYGSFANGPYPDPLAFSPDDNTIYQNVQETIQVFDTQTFQSGGTFNLPRFGTSGYGSNIPSLVTDNTGSYLFVSQIGSDTSLPGTFNNIGQVVVFGTGSGSGLPVGPAVVEITATKANVVAGSGGKGVFKITRAGGDLSQPLLIHYLIAGTAENGTDYNALLGTKRIPAGRASALIEVVPADDIPGYQVKTVRLSIQKRAAYEVGSARVGVVKIRAPR